MKTRPVTGRGSALVLGLLLAAPAPLVAEVILQGQNNPIPGDAITIGENLSVKLGEDSTNLFYNFSVFNIFAGESVTFTGPDRAIANVIARVSGDRPSPTNGLRSTLINGTLQSTVPSANLFVINPHGIEFGPGAEVHVDGSFYASTADRLVFGDVELETGDAPSALLKSANPTAFGFMGPTPGRISLQGAQLSPNTLTLGDGASFTLVGGDIEMRDGAFFTGNGFTTTLLNAPGARVDLVSGASAGSVPLNPAGGGTSFGSLGTVTLRNSSVVDAHEVYVRSGRLVIDGSIVSPGSAAQLGVPGPSPSGGGVRVQVSGETVIKGTGEVFNELFGPGSGLLPGIRTFNDFFAGGEVPGIDVESGSLTMSGPAAILSLRAGPGGSGGINVKADSIQVRDGANISSFNNFSGAGVDVGVTAGSILLRGDGGTRVTGISAQSSDLNGFQAESGSIVLEARMLEIRNGAQISTDSFGLGRGGNIDIRVDGPVVLDRDAAAAADVGTIGAQSAIAGDAGTITLRAHSLRMGGSFEISGSTAGFADAGRIDVDVTGDIVLSGDNTGIFSRTQDVRSSDVVAFLLPLFGLAPLPPGVSLEDFYGISFEDLLNGAGVGSVEELLQVFANDPAEPGAGGTIDLSASNLVMNAGTRIDSSTIGVGNAGDIFALVGNLSVADGAQLRSRSGLVNPDTLVTFVGPGAGGVVEVAASGEIRVSGTSSSGVASQISTSTLGPGDGGNVVLTAGNLLVDDGGLVSADTRSTGAAGGQGGTVRATTLGEIRVSGTSASGVASQISTSTLGNGDGGNVVLLTAGDLIVDNGGSVAAASLGSGLARGDGGTVRVVAGGEVRVAGGASQITTSSLGAGDGGDIDLRALDLTVEDGGTIAAASFGTGLAGDIVINTGRQVVLSSGSITTEAAVGDGGNIVLNTSRLLDIQNARVTTSVQSGVGGGGNIAIDPSFVVLQSSDIIANAFGGPGGNIRIVAGVFIADPNSKVQASSAQSIDGTIDIDAPDTDVSSSLATLPESFIDASSLLRGECDALRAGARGNSLVVSGRGGVSPNPDGYQASPSAGSTGARLVAAGAGASFQVRVEGSQHVMLASVARAPGGCAL